MGYSTGYLNWMYGDERDSFAPRTPPAKPEKPKKIFVATRETQGQRLNDFCYVEEGEIVIPPMVVCTNEEPDDACGCARSMSGLLEHKATTTMKVVLLDLSIEQLVAAIHLSLEKAGWIGSVFATAGLCDPNAEKIAHKLIT